MTFVAIVVPVILTVIAAVIGYALGNRQLRDQRLYERRVEVISELSERMYLLERTIHRYVMHDPSDTEGAEQRVQRADEALQDLIHYARVNAVWLEPGTVDKIEEFMHAAYLKTHQYADSMEEARKPYGDREAGKDAREAIMFLTRELPPIRRVVEAEFRTILYPAPWSAAPLRALAWLLGRGRNSRPADPQS